MKKIISEISQEERNRILEMHKKATINQHLVSEEMEPTTPEPKVAGGPLTGPMVVRNPDAEAEFGQTIEFKFRGIKNSGSAPMTVKRILPMNSNMTIDINKEFPFTLQPGETFDFTAKQNLVKNGTATQNMDINGVVEYEQRILIETDGKKAKYVVFCRQKLFFFDGNR
jgi:hypothetical protein